MNSLIYLPITTVLDFIVSVNKAVMEHSDPESDPILKESKRLADQLSAEAYRRQRAQEAEARRAATSRRSALEAASRREGARIASRKAGDFKSRGLIGF